MPRPLPWQWLSTTRTSWHRNTAIPWPSAPSPPGSSRAPVTRLPETTTSPSASPGPAVQTPVAICEASAELIRLPHPAGPSGWSIVTARPQPRNSLSSTQTPSLVHV